MAKDNSSVEEDFKVRHCFRKNKYQNCVITEIGKGCNGSIIVYCEDGFYGEPETASFCTMDLKKIY